MYCNGKDINIYMNEVKVFHFFFISGSEMFDFTDWATRGGLRPATIDILTLS